jgi:hypothetical protein
MLGLETVKLCSVSFYMTFNLVRKERWIIHLPYSLLISQSKLVATKT